ncbi:MAG: hypothetical protein EP329_23430 [Deltaproteobacteria bacterium]|nr:MAG: hypothetical protein EP329_23430 [Deltaproteobacteria bacterium]
MRRVLTAALCALLLVPVGCDSSGGGAGGKVTDAPTFGGKSDSSFAIAESGRFEGDTTVSGTVEGTEALAYRFNAWAGTKVEITLSSPGLEMDPYLVVDGPHPGGDGKIVAFNDDGPGDSLDSALSLTLTEPGAYRILVGSYGTFNEDPNDKGRFELTFRCLEGCEMPQISLAELLTTLEARLGADGVAQLLDQSLPALFPDAATQALVKQQVGAALAAPGAVEAFPVLPMSALSTVQGLFERPDAVAPAPEPVEFQLDVLLREGCSAERPGWKPVSPQLPGLETGTYADYTVDECNLQRAQELANVLNNLALENGSAVVSADARYETVEDVFRALIAAGHRVRIENQSFYANFLGLQFEGKAVIAPVWLDTGIALPDGRTLAIPAPHSHHTIHIDGPLLRGRLMYYMGVSGGVSWRAVAGLRSPWNGVVTRYTYDSAVDADQIVNLMVVAGELRKRWAEEGRSLPAEGYGVLGVCSDSSAVLELAAEGTVSIFPLAHGAVEAVEGDAVSNYLSALPSDIYGFDEADALRRIRGTLPVGTMSPEPFPGLASDLGSLAGQ